MRLFAALALGSCAVVACGVNDDLIARDTTLQPPPPTSGGGGGRRPGASSGDAGPSGSSSGAATGDGGSSGLPDSGPPPSPRCDAAAPVGLSAPVAGLPVTALSPVLSGSELRAFFLQFDGASYPVYEAVRAGRAAPFEPAVALGFVSPFAPPFVGIAVSDDALTVYTAQFQQELAVMVASRVSTAEPFGPAALYHASTYMDVTARDGSARFFTSYADGLTTLFGQRPAAADLATAEPLGYDAFVSWYDAPSATLWFTQFVQAENNAFYLPQSQHWNGASWDAPAAADLLVTWSSPDACRVYGTDGTGVVVRSRPPPP